MRRLFDMILIAAGMMVPACSGQSLLDQVSFESGQLPGGIHLVGVSVFSGYSTSAYPQAGYILPNSSLANLGGDGTYGASFSVGWQNHGQNGDLSMLYSGTYDGMFRYSNLDGYNQSLSISAAHKLGPKWTFTLSGAGTDSTLAQYVFQPSPTNVLTQVPASFDDLAAAAGAGQYTNTQVAALLTGSPILQSPARSLLLANRVLSYSAQAGLSYAVSARLQVHFAGFAAAGQSLLSSQDAGAGVDYIMPRTLGANAGVGFSYSVDPLTQIGVDLDENRSLNHFQNSYGTSAAAFIGRKIGQQWFLNVHGGGMYNIVTQQSYGIPVYKQVIGGGSLGFRTGMHTFIASYERSGSDGFGLAVGTITTTSGSWSLRQPGSRWGLFASFGEQQTRNAGFVSLSGWQGSAGINMTLNPRSSLSAQYVYMNSAGTYLGTYASVAVQSVRLSFGWSPQIVQR